MSLPVDIRQTINSLIANFDEDDDFFDIVPYRRKDLYAIIIKYSFGRAFLSWLDIVTYEQIASEWLRVWPHNTLPTLAIENATKYLQHGIVRVAAETDFINAWKELEVLGYTAEAIAQPRAFFAGHAACIALRTSLGGTPFDRLILNERMTDGDLDFHGIDAAACAAIAAAGEMWSKDFDPAKRRRFWRWWLEEAIPEAYARATHPF